jgi:hypothetical protein
MQTITDPDIPMQSLLARHDVILCPSNELAETFLRRFGFGPEGILACPVNWGC